jgi:3-mercaptopyruvate sulfurtransferase SseA
MARSWRPPASPKPPSDAVPVARNIPWAQPTNDDGTFKDLDALQEQYGSRGITGDSPLITYCRIGERSSHTWFVLTELLGYSNVRNYDGSWTEYGSVIGAPFVNSSVENIHSRDGLHTQPGQTR